MTTGHFSWRHLRLVARRIKCDGNGATVPCGLSGFPQCEFCFPAEDHVVTNQPNRSDATVIVVAPSGEAVVCTGKV